MRRSVARPLALSLAAIALLSGCQDPPAEGAVGALSGAAAPPPLYENLGTHSLRISTRNRQAQRYFDQGLRLTYAFNHAEAIRAYEAAAALDPRCAICHWGVALALGPNINLPMDSAAGVAAWTALQRARALIENASPRERALIEALATRYAEVPPADRAALDSAYARAMGAVSRRFPDDLDILTLWAEARMNLRPWAYWTKEGAPHPGTNEIVSDLERVTAEAPDHPGACHYYIHAVEAVAPAKAIPCAERLARLMPGAGHLVHMPAHVYVRVGRWADAIETNRHAVHTDEAYIADQSPTGVYPLAYYPHNQHFLSFAVTMIGRSEEAIRAARAVATAVPFDVAREVAAVEPLVPFLHLTLVTFGRWDEVLAAPVPPSELRFATGMVAYARGVAHAAKGDATAAAAALDTLRGIAAEPHDEMNEPVLQLALHALQGEIAFRGDDLAGAARHFRAAIAVEDELPYMEPPHWYYPVRHSLGAVLLRQGDAAGAERIYQEDLRRFPSNGWALYGLWQSLRAQGGSAEAAADAEQRFARTWASADVQLTASRY
jgi:tetratricopeptide (TPR) repeat protein